MAKDAELSTDWLRSAGDFSCTKCSRKRLPASEFSKKQVERMLEACRSLPERDIRSGQESVVYLSGVCKKCTEEKEQQERADAEKRREEREAAVAEAVIGAPQLMPVTIAERPFGMSPAKEAEVGGYLVAKATEGKPAAKAGVRPGWRLVEVAGQPCGDLSLEEAQALMKAASLPAALVFEAVPDNADFCTACERLLPAPSFSRKMRTRPPAKRRCSACVEAAEGEEAEEKAAAEAPGQESTESKPTNKLDELRALCADSAKQAEKVTGLKATRGGGYLGRGKGGRGGGRR